MSSFVWQALSVQYSPPRRAHRLGKRVHPNHTRWGKIQACNPLPINRHQQRTIHMTRDGIKMRSIRGQGCRFPLNSFTNVVRSADAVTPSVGEDGKSFMSFIIKRYHPTRKYTLELTDIHDSLEVGGDIDWALRVHSTVRIAFGPVPGTHESRKSGYQRPF